MNPLKFCLIILFVFFLMPVCVNAQGLKEKANDEHSEMNVDMPDETVETAIVDLEQLQVETGILYNRFEEKPNAFIGQLMVRYGLNKWMEIRMLAEDGHQRDRYMEETVQSNAPLAFGLKIVLLKDQGILPDITFASGLKLPFTSRNSEQYAYWSPLFLLAFQNKFGKGEGWKLEYNIGGQQEVYSKQWVLLGNASLHYKIIQPLEIFMEYFAQYQPGENPQHNMGGGFAYQMNKRMEVYISGGSTIDYQPGNYFFNGGLAIRTN